MLFTTKIRKLQYILRKQNLFLCTTADEVRKNIYINQLSFKAHQSIENQHTKSEKTKSVLNEVNRIREFYKNCKHCTQSDKKENLYSEPPT